MAWPSAFVAGNTVTAAQLNGIQAAGLAWTSYAPTIGGFTVGNALIVGRWLQMGKTIFVEASVTLGSTSVVTGALTVSLPTAANWANFVLAGSVKDASAVTYFPLAFVADSVSTLVPRAWPTTAGNALVNTSATVPMTWAQSDILTVSGTYESP